MIISVILPARAADALEDTINNADAEVINLSVTEDGSVASETSENNGTLVFNAAEDFNINGNSGTYWKAYYSDWGNPYKLMDGSVSKTTGGIGVGKKTLSSVDVLLPNSTVTSAALKDNATPCFVGNELISTGDNQARYTVAKGFTAPYTGKIKIEQNNLLTENDDEKSEIWVPATENFGILINITKNGLKDKAWPAGEEERVWTGEDGTGRYDFKPIELDVTEGDTIYFNSCNKEGWTNAWSCYIHWNPVVTYKSIYPTVESLSASDNDFKTAGLKQTYTVKYKEEIESISKDNIKISGALKDGSALTKEPTVKELVFSKENNSAEFSFSGLEKGASYIVELSGMKFNNMNTDEYKYTFEFSTRDASEFASYKASDSYSETSNENSVWKWQYMNDDITYVDLPRAASGGSSVNAGAAQQGFSVGKAWTNTSGWWYGLGVGKYVMVGGNQANASYVSTSDMAVRTFIAPSSGYVEITACDPDGESKIWSNMSSTNSPGATLSIKKTEADDIKFMNRQRVWPEKSDYVFRWDGSLSDGGRGYEFKPVTVAVNKGDRIHFEASSMAGNWWGQVVYWDPVVTYKAIFPENSVNNFEDGGVYAPNFEYTMEFNDDMAELSADNITIDNEASVKTVELTDGNTVKFSFSNIKQGIKYNVTVNGLRYDSVSDETMSVPYTFTFYGGKTVEAYGAFLSNGHIAKGRNSVTVNVNNSDEKECSAAMLVCLMRGTADDYEVESVKYVSRNDIGANDRMNIDIDVPDETDRFIRVLVVNSIGGLKPYSEIMDLR